MHSPITIIVSPRNPPLGRGRFEVRLGDRVILKSSRQPLLDAARVFLAEGVPPDTRIAMRHAGSDHDALSSTIGKAAGLTVAERDRGNGPYFEPWQPDRRYASVEQPPMRLGPSRLFR
jgi:hypothetical protein